MTEKRIDLHTHTTASDGIVTPSGLIDFALENHIEVLAITDHDTVAGLPEAMERSVNRNIILIPGIEFSVQWDRGTFHIVGLYIDHENGPLRSRVNWLAERRSSRAQRIVEDLDGHDIRISFDEVLDEARGGVVGKPHIARVLVRHGYASNTKDVFSHFLEKGKPGYVPKEKVTYEEAIALIKGAGGIPVLAHPGSLEYSDYDDFENMLRQFMKAGLEGVEVYSEMHSAGDVSAFHDIATRNNLLISGGSDFHGDKEEKIGYYAPENPIPFGIYEALVRHRMP